MSSAVIGSSVRAKEVGPPSHHVVVIVPVDDVGRREQLLLDRGGRGRGQLQAGLEQVGHVEYLEETDGGKS